jgi:hypothetical protein
MRAILREPFRPDLRIVSASAAEREDHYSLGGACPIGKIELLSGEGFASKRGQNVPGLCS